MAAGAFCSFIRLGLGTGAGLICCTKFASGSNPKIVTPVRHGHWFTKYYSRKWTMRPISQEVLEKYQERSTAKLPNETSAPFLLRKYLDDSIPESVRKIHSYEFTDIEAAIKDVMKEKTIEMGLDPAQDSTAHEIVRLTVRVRVLREQMNTKNYYALERSLLDMLDRRRELLKALRSEDYNQFLRLTTGLELSFSHEPRPGQAETPKPGFPSRLAETRDRCQSLKQRRLGELARRTEAAKADFLKRREAALKDAAEKLNSLGLSLDQVLDEVYADRRARAEADLLEDQLHWFYGEQRAHIKYVAKLAEKAKAAQTRGKK